MRCQFKEVTSMRLQNATKILKNVHTVGPNRFGFNKNVLQCISFIDVLMSWLSWNLGASTSWNPQGLSRPVKGLLFCFALYTHTHTRTHARARTRTRTHARARARVYIYIKQSKKAVPLQAWTGPEGSRRLRLPDFKTFGTQRW